MIGALEFKVGKESIRVEFEYASLQELEEIVKNLADKIQEGEI